MYWQYTTASAGAEVKLVPASPKRMLAAIPVIVIGLIKILFL
jgi:hypothetical protein